MKACVSIEFLKKYAGVKEVLFSYKVMFHERISEPYGLPPGKRPPQSWCYYATVFKDKKDDLIQR